MRYILALIGFWLVLSVSIAGAQCFPEASCRVTEPSQPAQVVAEGDTINLRESCGTVKPITTDDGGAVTTSTTETFTSSGHAGCIVTVCNVNASDAITLDSNSNFASSANITLDTGDCVIVAEYPKGTWRNAAAQGVNLP